MCPPPADPRTRPPLPRRRPPTAFQPRFTVALLYLFGLFFLYCFLLVAPELYDVWSTVPPGPEQEAVAAELVREALGPRLGVAIAAAIATLLVGAYARVLPGLHPPQR